MKQKIVFISYADKNMSYSLQRIGRQAKKLKLFDEVILWTPEMLSKEVLKSPLFQYSRGGGYWLWKPVIINETLKKFPEGTIVVYCDAGCSLQKSQDWNHYFDLINDKDIICFEYKDQMPEWEKFKQTSTKIQYWTKQETIDFFNKYLNDNQYSEKYNKILGGFLIAKGRKNKLITDWLRISLEFPNLIMDPLESEKYKENKNLAYHKHDQSIITPLAHLYEDEVCILTEKCETVTTSAVVMSRIRVRSYKQYLLHKIKNAMRVLLGLPTYNSVKGIYKKVKL